MKTWIGILLAVFVTAVLLGAGCTQNNSNGSGTPSSAGAVSAPSANGGNVTPSSGSAGGQVQEFRVLAKSFTFEPDTIQVKQGDRVRITLTSTDVPHGIGISEFNFSLVANAGETKSGEFTASKAGNFTFFCNVFCGDGHRTMKGTLVVTP